MAILLFNINKNKTDSGFFYSQSIGQAYEDMQTQNQHLLQQITERDDYNIKVGISSGGDF